MQLAVTEPTRRKRTGRPPQVDPISDSVKQLIFLAKERDATVFSNALQNRLNQYLDEELEVLATWVLSVADFDHRVPEVLGPLGRGEHEQAMQALCSRMKRRFAKALRDHQRSEADDFYDSCTVE